MSTEEWKELGWLTLVGVAAMLILAHSFGLLDWALR